MNRRIYFVSPDVPHAREVIDEAVALGVELRNIHTMAGLGVDLEELPQATPLQQQDMLHTIEGWLWRINLTVFFLALFGLLWTLFDPSWLSIAMLAIMALTFIGGFLWTRVPDTPVNEFRPQLSHGEILIMIDLPEGDLPRVEQQIHHHHPEAIEGGTSWMVDAMGL